MRMLQTNDRGDPARSWKTLELPASDSKPRTTGWPCRYLYQASTRRRFTRTASEGEAPWDFMGHGIAWEGKPHPGQTPGLENQPQASPRISRAGSDEIGWRLADVLVADLDFFATPFAAAET